MPALGQSVAAYVNEGIPLVTRSCGVGTRYGDRFADRRHHVNSLHIGYERDPGTGDDEPDPDPYPHDEWVEVHFQNWVTAITCARVDDIQVFLRRGVIRDHGGRLVGCVIDAALGVEGVDLAAVLVNVDHGGFAFVVGVVVLRGKPTDERVGTDRHGAAIGQFLLLVLVEGCATETDHDNDDAEVDDVATIAASVAAGELHHSGEDIGVLLGGDHPAAT